MATNAAHHPSEHFCGGCPEGFEPVEARPWPMPESSDRRWFITMGHAGFNLRANNGNGWATRAAAIAAARRCGHGSVKSLERASALAQQRAVDGDLIPVDLDVIAAASRSGR